MASAEREIKRMDELIAKLYDTANVLVGAVKPDHMRAITDVICEWRDSTKECIEELAQELNQD